MKNVSLWLAALLIIAAGLAHGASITVNRPAGGELCLGKTVPIQWTVAGFKGKVKIVLLKGNTTVGQIAREVDAIPSSFKWEVGMYKGGTAGVDSGYCIRVKAINEDVEGTSGKFGIKKCGGGDPPPPDNQPRMKSPIEIMQQPPKLNPPTLVQPPNTIVLSQLPKARIVKFLPDRSVIGQGQKITFTIEAENVTQAVLHDDASKQVFPLDKEIKQNGLRISCPVEPKGSGTWRLAVANLSSRDEGSQPIQVVAKPAIVLFKLSNPSHAVFSPGSVIPVEIQVKNADSVSVINDITNEILKQYSVPAGVVDFMPTFDFRPEHSCEIRLKAENKAGIVFSQKICLENQMEIPVLHNFELRPADLFTAVVKYEIRGVMEFYILSKPRSLSDVPANWKEDFRFATNGRYTGTSSNIPLAIPPIDYRIVVKLCDGIRITINKAIESY